MLKVNKRELEDDLTILCLQGQLVTGETDALCEAVRSQFPGVELVLDLGQVSRIDAGGLGRLIELREHALANGSHFKLINVSRLIQEVFVISRLDSVFELLPERAINSLLNRPGKTFERMCA